MAGESNGGLEENWAGWGSHRERLAGAGDPGLCSCCRDSQSEAFFESAEVGAFDDNRAMK